MDWLEYLDGLARRVLERQDLTAAHAMDDIVAKVRALLAKRFDGRRQMRTRGVVEMSVTIRTPVEDVWRTLVEPEQMTRWMGGAHVESTWEVGSEITFSGKLLEKPYRDHGTVRDFEPCRLLRYDHWSRFSRLSDTPENRSVVALRLESEGGSTRLSVRHEPPPAAGASEHVAFFWRMALEDIKRLAGIAASAKRLDTTRRPGDAVGLD